jgi:hypothetical protein
MTKDTVKVTLANSGKQLATMHGFSTADQDSLEKALRIREDDSANPYWQGSQRTLCLSQRPNLLSVPGPMGLVEDYAKMDYGLDRQDLLQLPFCL